MNPPIFYTSLAIYSKQDISDEIERVLEVIPTRTGEKGGTFSWIYSTQGASNCHTIEEHLQLLKSQFYKKTHELNVLSAEMSEIRVWIYFGMEDVNQAFIVSPELISWLSVFGADVCVDVWSRPQ